ncbi:MAG TPA: hypothetical protein G4O00_06280 [Thermoflexia bacterium]|jgi:predicted AlkP superfamily phosphohydrolase/phosphomutase|nr:hypothetical protein [Thermoflexia bacterium]
MGRIVILGFDGATFDLLDPWMEQGQLPHFARLVEEGSRAVLLSTVPPMSPQAWATFQTGVNPGKHGIYQFTESDLHIPTTPVTSFSLRVPPFWRFFSDAGWRVGIVNVFATYPPQPVNGFVIAGRNVPSGRPYMFPPNLFEEVRDRVGKYIVDVDPYHAERSLKNISEEGFLALLHRMVDTRIRTVRYLQETYSPDLLVVVFTVTDMVQHFFWHYLDPSHPAYPGPGETSAHTAILDIYRVLDGFVGEMVGQMEPSDMLMVVSDHGFGPWYKELNLNRWLIENGWMRLCSPNRPSRLLKDWAKRLLPRSLLRPLLRTYSQHRRRRSAYEEKPIEWTQTKAFAHGHYGNIYINLKGREPLGIVAPGEEYKQVRDAICRGLEEWINPATGQPAVKRAWRKEELYHGPYTDYAPDIVVEWADYAYVGSRATNYGEPIIHEVHCFYRNLIQSGSHRREGILLLKGAGVRSNYAGSVALLQDIAPTILYLGGQPVPSYMDGRVLTDLLEPQFVEDQPPQSVQMEPLGYPMTAGENLTPEESEEILERLKGLGYLE